MTKKIQNKLKITPQIKTEISREDFLSYAYKKENLVIDFSYQFAFASAKFGDTDNYLHDERDFLERFTELMANVTKLSDHTAYELISEKGFRHCHKLSNDKVDVSKIVLIKAAERFSKDESYIQQIIGGEDLYQLGFETEIRMIGLLSGNRFRVLMLDYHHVLFPDERRNTRPRQGNSYSLL